MRRCPKCNGYVNTDWDGDLHCANCGWRPTREPTADDMKGYREGSERKGTPRRGGAGASLPRWTKAAVPLADEEGIVLVRRNLFKTLFTAHIRH